MRRCKRVLEVKQSLPSVAALGIWLVRAGSQDVLETTAFDQLYLAAPVVKVLEEGLL